MEQNNELSDGRVGALEITVNLFSFLLLWVSVFACGSILFNVINYYFPDPLAFYMEGDLASMSASVTYGIASLIVAFPLYLYSIRYWLGVFIFSPEKREARLSRFLTYLILLAASLVMVGDIITLVYNFLQGEFTSRFFLKVLVILILAGITFLFYYRERSFVQYKKSLDKSSLKKLAIFALALALVSIALGFIAYGSPMTQRARRYDSLRAQDLQNIESSISSYVWENGKAPESLEDLANNDRYGYIRISDPETGIPYKYKVIKDSTKTVPLFELCATFVTNTKAENRVAYRQGFVWETHQIGEMCLTRESTKSPDFIEKPIVVPR